MIVRLLFFLLVSSTAFSQNILSGTVTDYSTGRPIELVTVGILKKGTGTSTNADGQFRLMLPKETASDTIRFTMIGYKSVAVPVREFKDNQPIQLQPETYSLDEVTIRAKKLTANDVIKKVVESRIKNYDQKPFRLEAYYRDLRKVDGRYDHLIEVALNIYGKNIDNYHQSVELLQTRKIDLVRFAHEENLLNQILRLDYIANNEGFIKLSDFKKNNYRFDDIRIEDGKNIYVISTGVLPERKYTFYINEDDFAIVRLEMEDRYAEKQKLYLAPVDKTHQFRLRTFKVINTYKPLNGKYYPDYLSVLWDYDRYNTVTRSVYENGLWQRELKVTQVTAANTAKPDPSKLMTKFGAAIDDQMTLYDPEFWKGYNTVPLTAQAMADLTRGGPLDEQFIRNGNRARKRKTFRCDKDLSPVEKVACLINNYQDQYDIPGGQLAVMHDGKIIFSKAFGYANVAEKKKVTTETPFRIASVSKTMTAAAAMKLIEEKKLDADVPVQRYVPQFPQKKWMINSKHLLTNTGGIRHYVDSEDFFRTEKYTSMTDAIAIIKDDSLLFEPGTDFYYSSYGFNLLGAVIEGASGMNFMDYLQKSVIEPAQMTHTYGGRQTEAESRYYVLKDIQRAEAPEDNISYKISSGGIVSTAEDLVKFGNALMRGDIVSKETFQQLLTTYKTKSGDGTGYSFGWFVDTDSNGMPMIHHSGTALSYSAHLLIYPSKNIVVAYIANTGMDTYFDKDMGEEVMMMMGF